MQLNIPAQHQSRMEAAMKGLYAIPMIPDPASTPETPLPAIPEFTDSQWAREAVVRNIRRDVYRWESAEAGRVAAAAIAQDETMVT